MILMSTHNVFSWENVENYHLISIKFYIHHISSTVRYKINKIKNNLYVEFVKTTNACIHATDKSCI